MAEDDVTIDPVEDETENQDIFDLDGAMDEVGMTDQDTDIQSLADDPNTFLADNDLLVSDNYTELDPDATGTNLDATDDRYDLGDDLDIDNTNTVDEDDAELANEITDIPDAAGYSDNVETVLGDLGTPETTVDAAQGTVSDDAQVDASEIEIDMEGAATGVNEDGTVNRTGEALNDFASQDFTRIIDTSTTSGRLLAEELGEGNYTDAKATIAGQMEIISRQFKDPDTGEPVIPPWAQGTARMLRRTISFDGMSGTAATAAMANAIMEATIGISKDEAAFFQNLTTKNLDNRQESIINKASTLAKFEEANLGAREAAAVHNAKAFLEMDMLNVEMEQEAEIINTQERIDVMLSDAAETNVARRFDTEQENDFTKYYDNLNANIQMHRSEQLNQIKRFNAGELNDGGEFEAEMEDSRQRYYADMQYQIDSDNAQWRQSVTETNTELAFDAQTEDVRNGLDLSQEAMNQMWDRVDSLLDHTVNNYNSDADRDANILATTITAQSRMSAPSNDPIVEGLFTLAAAAISSRGMGGVGGAGSDIDVIGGTLGAAGNVYNWVTGANTDLAADGIDLLAGAENVVNFITGAEGDKAADFSSLPATVTTFTKAIGLTGEGGALGSMASGFGSMKAWALANPWTAGIVGITAVSLALKEAGIDVDVNPFDEGVLEIDLVDSAKRLMEGDVDLNPFDDGALEIDLVGSIENVTGEVDLINRDYLDWGW